MVSRLGIGMVVLTLDACGGALPPLRGEIDVGQDSYAVFVAGSALAGGDLYAVRTSGGPAVPITFTAVGEMRPALAPDGGAALFLRGGSLADSTPATVWVMNLLNGAERELSLPKGAGAPEAAGWDRGGRSVVVATHSALYRMNAPPSSPEPRVVGAGQRAAAESSLQVLLGSPVFARVEACANPRDLCVAADTGAPGLLAHGARDAFRWGADSVAFFIGDEVEVRPVGPGRGRRLAWTDPPPQPRQMTVFVSESDR